MSTPFNNTKYTRWYWQIIAKRVNNSLGTDTYSEEHHVVPESFFAERSRPGPSGWLDGNPEDPSNKVLLTAREHFICHWLLTKMTDGVAQVKMCDALEMMNVDSENQTRYRTLITSRVFERNRIQVAKNRSERMSGDANPAKRPEVGLAISAAKTGVKRKPFSKEWIDNLTATRQGERNGMYGKNHSEETKQLLREQQLGKKQSAETVAKKAAAIRGHKKPLIHCVHCGRDIASNGYARWHGDYCEVLILSQLRMRGEI